MKKSKFTLIEILVVVAILAILLGLVAGSMGGFMDSGKVQAARKDMSKIQLALAAYQSEYGNLPVRAGSNEVINPNKGSGDLTRYQSLISILSGSEKYGGKIINGSEFKKFNFRKKSFWEPPPDYSNSEYDLKDPWGNYYVFQFDIDGDGKAGNVTNAGEFIIWSYGPLAEDDPSQLSKIESEFNSRATSRKIDGFIWNGKDGVVTSWIDNRNADNEDDESK